MDARNFTFDDDEETPGLAGMEDAPLVNAEDCGFDSHAPTKPESCTTV